MEKDNMLATVGRVAFIVGVILALLVGILSGYLQGDMKGYITGALIVLGLITGFLNVTEKETSTFIMTTTALVIVAALGGTVLENVPMIGNYLVATFSAIVSFIIPATIIVGLKAIFTISKD
jgi:hypothetical protein